MHNEVVWLAYHVAAFSRAKRIPRLDKLLIRRRRRQPVSEQMQVAKMLTMAFGGRVR